LHQATLVHNPPLHTPVPVQRPLVTVQGMPLMAQRADARPAVETVVARAAIDTKARPRSCEARSL